MHLFATSPDTFHEWVLAGAGASTLIVFAVALQNFFVQPPTLTRPQRLFQDISILVGVTHAMALLILDSASDVWSWVGIGLYTASLILFLASIEAARRVPLTRTFVYTPRVDRILTTGPFRLVRHPIYLSYSLAWAAAPVAKHSVVLGLTAAVMITCYLISAREEERVLASGPRGAEYRALAAKTWRLIPFVY